MSLQPTEKEFEVRIEKCLKKSGYSSVTNKKYDKNLCLIREDLLHFIQSTQKEQWDNLVAMHGVAEVEEKILSKITKEISKRGVVDVLRGKVKDKGIELDLYYPKPRSGMNLEYKKLYKQNKFSVVRQLFFSQYSNESIDMVIFLNGLPIVTMELKSSLSKQNIKNAERQYKEREHLKEPIFSFKQCMVHFCVDSDLVSMSTNIKGESTLFLPFNRELPNPPVDGDCRTNYLWNEVLVPDSVLDIIENFIHLSVSKDMHLDKKKNQYIYEAKELLVFPRYHQLDLIRKLRMQLIEDDVGNNYLVQHTTGSGKSYSIGWLTHMLASFYKSDADKSPLFDSVIIVTDRKILDAQLRNTVHSLAKTKGVISAADKGSDLSNALEKGKKIIITTIQKFPHAVNKISSLKGSKFAVIIDEVHSSQSGKLTQKMQQALGNEYTEDSNYEDYIRAEIQTRGKQDHISYFGFTGTPKAKTLEIFGTQNAEGQFKAFHVYSMSQSIKEGFTLDVLKNYTTIQRYFELAGIPQDKDTKAPAARTTKEIMRAVDYSSKNIEAKVTVILNHWINIGSKKINGRSRGLIVTSHRKQCVLYFEEINRQLKERGMPYRCLVAFSDEVTVNDNKHSEKTLNS
ncbi:MAG: type I restriction endonuclease subunit R, partial [Endozoicomonadaceae bacterium]|nr:type I restriction endonuclease subunit R [Endozoicomonadaceae bacterium]